MTSLLAAARTHKFYKDEEPNIEAGRLAVDPPPLDLSDVSVDVPVFVDIPVFEGLPPHQASQAINLNTSECCQYHKRKTNVCH